VKTRFDYLARLSSNPPAMKNLSIRWMMIASLLAAGAILNLACSSSDGTPDAGTTGTGGKIDAGSPGTGGKIDSGTPVTHLLAYTFDTSTQAWDFDQYAATNERNLGLRTLADAGASPDAQTLDGGVVAAPTVTVDTVVGSPTPGSLKVTVTFTDCNQYVDPVVGITPALNLMGKTIHVKFQQTSGAFSGGAQLHASSGTAYVYVASPIVLPTTPGTFADGALDLAAAMGPTGTVFDPTAIVQVGIKIFSGYAPTCTTYANAGALVTFNIDTVTD
jgi:hypothetical protein